MTKNSICGQQFGFRKHHSTSHAINYSVNLILDGIQSQKHVLGIFIDLSKAFDTIKARGGGGGVKVDFPVFTYLIRAAGDEQEEKNRTKI